MANKKHDLGMRTRKTPTAGAPTCGHPDRPILARGMCSPCYQKALRRGELTPLNDGTCAHCQINPPLRYGPYCRACKRIRDAAYRYGIDVERWEALWDESQGLCSICSCLLEIEGPNRSAHAAVDHDHATGVVRALLCCCCNAGLGQFREDIFTMRAAIAYLEKHEHIGGNN